MKKIILLIGLIIVFVSCNQQKRSNQKIAFFPVTLPTGENVTFQDVSYNNYNKLKDAFNVYCEIVKIEQFHSLMKKCMTQDFIDKQEDLEWNSQKIEYGIIDCKREFDNCIRVGKLGAWGLFENYFNSLIYEYEELRKKSEILFNVDKGESSQRIVFLDYSEYLKD